MKRLLITFLAAILVIMALSSIALAAYPDIGEYGRELIAGQSQQYSTGRNKYYEDDPATHKNTESYRTIGVPTSATIVTSVYKDNTTQKVTYSKTVSSGGIGHMYYYAGQGQAYFDYNLKIYNPNTYPIYASGYWCADDYY